MNALVVILAPLAIALFALVMERFEAIVVGTRGEGAKAEKATVVPGPDVAPAEAPEATRAENPAEDGPVGDVGGGAENPAPSAGTSGEGSGESPEDAEREGN